MKKLILKCAIPILILVLCFTAFSAPKGFSDFKYYLSSIGNIKHINKQIDESMSEDYVSEADSLRGDLVSLTDKVGTLKSIVGLEGVSDYTIGSYDSTGKVNDLSKDFTDDYKDIRYVQVTVITEDSNAFLDKFNALKIPASKLKIEPLKKAIVIQLDFKIGGQI